MKTQQYILLALLIFPLVSAAQDSSRREQHRKFISSLKYCNFHDLKDTACQRSKESWFFNEIVVNEKLLRWHDYTDNSTEKLDLICSQIQNTDSKFIVFRSRLSGRHTDLWLNSFQSDTAHAIKPGIGLSGIYFQQNGDFLFARMLSSYKFEIYEFDSAKYLLNTYTNAKFQNTKHHLNKQNYFGTGVVQKYYDVKLKYIPGHIYNFQLRGGSYYAISCQ